LRRHKSPKSKFPYEVATQFSSFEVLLTHKNLSVRFPVGGRNFISLPRNLRFLHSHCCQYVPRVSIHFQRLSFQLWLLYQCNDNCIQIRFCLSAQTEILEVTFVEGSLFWLVPRICKVIHKHCQHYFCCNQIFDFWFFITEYEMKNMIMVMKLIFILNN